MKLLLVRVWLIASVISFVPVTTAAPQEAAANASLTARAAGGNTAEARTPDLLHQFNDSLQALAAKVSPAVVQITVTGFGPRTRVTTRVKMEHPLLSGSARSVPE
ncbi:MAG: hypothetical protein WBV55_16160 [Candidatus Sulfotelmatobacter sp.]